MRETGGLAFEPRVHFELAELADATGDEERRKRANPEARRLLAEMGVPEEAQPVL